MAIFNLINYSVEPDRKIAIREIYYDENLMGAQSASGNERPALYEVKKVNENISYEGLVDEAASEALLESWAATKPIERIETEYAAVNGMQNNLEKAAALMGVHLDVAYRTAGISNYTLFHNRTEGKWVDLIECLWDRSPTPTNVAMYLASALKQRQLSGKKTKWLVHSQGAIIFASAVEQHLDRQGGDLSNHEVAVHAPGTHYNRINSCNEASWH